MPKKIDVNLTEEEEKLIIENAIRNFEPTVQKTIEGIVNYILKSTATRDKRQQLLAKVETISNEELEVLLSVIPE